MRHLVTAALPYANGPLHIGHIAGAYLPADIFARYLRLRGREVLFICGSDEHGVAITLRAFQENTTPQAIIDKYHPLLEQSLRGMGISMDFYGRTSDPLHHEVSQRLFLRLLEKGWLEKRSVEQFWDPQAQTFLPDRYIVGTCPHCGYEEAYGDQCEKCGALLAPTDLRNPRSRLTGAVPEKRTSEQYYLRLDALQPKIEAYVRRQTWKPNVGPVIENWLKAGLAPRAITRDLSWGVPVPLPEMQSKVLYVWFEAPLGYISISQRWAQSIGEPERWKDFWKSPDTHITHFIGKDNIVFHTIIFPAVLMAAEEGYTLPAAVPANEFLNLEGQKLSTSRRWSIDIHEYLKAAPHRVDELRFVLTALMPQTKDRDFTWEEFATRINNELVATLTNLIHRILTLLWRYGGEAGVTPPDYLLQARAEAARTVAAKIEAYDFSGALEDILHLAQVANKSLTESAPWHKPQGEALSIVASYADLLAALGTLLEPFLPVRVAPSLRAQIGVELFPWERLEEPTPLISHVRLKDSPQPLVVKLSSEELQHLRAQLFPTASTSASSAPMEYISIEDFQKVQLRVVTIRAAERVPKADKLLKLTIESADGIHTVVSGVAQHYSPEELVGKQAVWVANLAPRSLRGIQSEGMLLFAEDREGRLVRVAPESPVTPGSLVK
ncbi:MAG: methionine--tRNA ligase [Bacteroidia bacterium]|nr:methionine--tRNA ligase [Bacteroidia bacterium]